MYRADILADSVGPHGVRLTTFGLTIPRMVLADITRHRCASFSVESTRAVPLEDKDGKPGRITTVREDPFVPVFRERVAGMARGKPLEGREKTRAEDRWRRAASNAAKSAAKLQHVEKGLAGRLLEPFLWVSLIMSATEWENFFALRDHEAAQYELAVPARMMRKAHETSIPEQLAYGDWHLPLVEMDSHVPEAYRFYAHVSAGRCAAISYLKHSVDEDEEKSAERWTGKLQPSQHWSPGEHPAMCYSREWETTLDFGNYAPGWLQLRKFYPGNQIAKGAL